MNKTIIYACGHNEVAEFYDKNIVSIFSISGKIYYKHFPVKPYVQTFYFSDTFDARDNHTITQSQVNKIFEYFKSLKSEMDNGNTRNGNILVNCRAGVSRSTAVALIGISVFNPEYTFINCLDELIGVRPCAMPNPLVAKYADIVFTSTNRFPEESYKTKNFEYYARDLRKRALF